MGIKDSLASLYVVLIEISQTQHLISFLRGQKAVLSTKLRFLRKMNRNEQTLQIVLEEYRTLKTEQSSRIGFRDNLLYVTLGLFGAISSFALSKSDNYHAFLVIPWVCLVMGWTYLVNDEKISAIGRYIRDNLEKRISKLIDGAADDQILFGWEVAHRGDSQRVTRKYLQLFIDLLTFVFSGLTALVGFLFMSSKPTSLAIALAVIEMLLLIGLSFGFIAYAELAQEEQIWLIQRDEIEN